MSQTFDIISPSSVTLWTFIPILGLMILLAGFFGYLLYASYNTQVDLSNEGLVITGALYSRNIGFDKLDFEGARIEDLETNSNLQPKLRTNGIGLPGYQAGWFKLRNGRKALLHVTDKHSVLFIPTRMDYDVLLSVERPNEFLVRLNQIGNGDR